MEAFSVSLVHAKSPTFTHRRIRKTANRAPFEWLDGEAALLGRPRRIGSLTSTAQIHPEKLTRALIESAGQLSGTTLKIARVHDVKCESEQHITVHAADKDGCEATMKCTKLVLAMGPWSMNAIKWFPKLPPVVAQKAASLVVKESVPAHALFTEYVDADGSALQPEAYPRADEVYVCHSAFKEALPDDPATIKPHEHDVAILRDFAGALSAKLKLAVDDESKTHAQACNLPVSPDGLPIIGKVPGVSNAFIATGHSCWGILNSPETGKAIAELVISGTSESVDLRPFSPDRFRRH